jgi:hypothetical protein
VGAADVVGRNFAVSGMYLRAGLPAVFEIHAGEAVCVVAHTEPLFRIEVVVDLGEVDIVVQTLSVGNDEGLQQRESGLRAHRRGLRRRESR